MNRESVRSCRQKVERVISRSRSENAASCTVLGGSGLVIRGSLRSSKSLDPRIIAIGWSLDSSTAAAVGFTTAVATGRATSVAARAGANGVAVVVGLPLFGDPLGYLGHSHGHPLHNAVHLTSRYHAVSHREVAADQVRPHGCVFTR
jgi:hypothetical protein